MVTRNMDNWLGKPNTPTNGLGSAGPKSGQPFGLPRKTDGIHIPGDFDS